MFIRLAVLAQGRFVRIPAVWGSKIYHTLPNGSFCIFAPQYFRESRTTAKGRD